MTILSQRRQRGNTLTGFIIGLIIGLGIAVAVALTITKGATPFTDKSGKLGRPADPAPSDAADPNKPLYGNREAARAANRALIEKEDKADKTVAAKPAATAAAPADADPLGKVIASLKEPADRPALSTTPPPAVREAAPAAAGEDRVTYYLQAGAFREMADAESTRAKLALLGFEAAISDRNSDSGVLHRVRVGPYAQVEAMNKARAKLLDSGVDVAIVRNQK
ncbi:SPOR domain-containing protein [Massilia sp. S19_KUP03_FR1]|uniref:SPOR domain-containing protein n=1 Tax=Massilia sp. S19_KUP03_FR1 TaxID=3025503 RepID=UPI002FCD553F